MKDLITKVLRFRKVLMGRDLYVTRQIKVRTLSLGNTYASWSILPDRLNQESVIYSFGVGTDISFDLQLIEICNATIHAFDPTPKSINWINTLELPEKFIFHPIGIATQDGKMDFFLPKNENHVSGSIEKNANTSDKMISVEVNKLGTIMNKLKHQHIDLLKMDVEGSEYDIIEYIVRNDIDVKQLLVEFHHRFKEIGITKTKKAIQALNKKGYKIFHVSPLGEEIAFTRH